MITATLDGLEKIQSLVVHITGHPRRIVGSIDTGVSIDIWVVSVIILHWHILEVRYIVMVGLPVITRLGCCGMILVGAIGYGWEEPIATILTISKEVVLLVC